MIRVVRAYNVVARQKNWTPRSLNSIRHKLTRLGISSNVLCGYYTLSKVASLLNVSRYTVQGWTQLKKNPLATYRKQGFKTFKYVTPLMFKKFAQMQKVKLGGLDRVGLLILTEDPDLVDEILHAYPRRIDCRFPRKRVRCIETGKIYSSMTAAARDVHVVRQGISRAIEQGHRAAGYHFEVIQ